ncbi:hypothetical protein [uncultured Acetobacterium sp.]|uniref:hypothetical protein n=1 Tax=uncultured Acetobacterium sp. TaxID=217139 RepID=UPI0025EFAFEC|nr:hypothetical protein [uncultured Acetobacterium sp.]
MEKVTVDKDVFDFLKYVYFKSLSNCYQSASRRAYLDMCRTIRFNNKNGHETRKNVDALIEKEIKALIETGVVSQVEYDAWHFELCRLIKQVYDEQEIDFYIGQSQKWVNMAMKYLYIIGESDLTGIFEFLHVPLDNYIFDAVEKELGIKKPKVLWSRMTDYDADYIPYQRQIREAVDMEPLRWEFMFWLKEIKEQKK